MYRDIEACNTSTFIIYDDAEKPRNDILKLVTLQPAFLKTETALIQLLLMIK